MALRDIFKFRDPPESETSKPFLEHLEDLRWTIVKMALTLGIAMIVCFAFRSTLVRVIQAPLNHLGSQVGTLKALGITDSIVISFHLAFYAGIVLSFPLLLYFLAEFVLPALTAVEKRFLFPAIAVSFALFLLGVLVCYFWLLPKTILFFFRDTESLGWAPTWTVQQYYSFVTRFTIGFGLAFELPVVVLALVRFGLITYRFMARTRPYAIVLIFILATIITPTPDILTLIAMALPMCLLYESCIWIAWLMERRASKRHRQLIACSIRLRIFSSVCLPFVLGAAVGSFLNVCIYRWPVDLSINRAASFVLSAVQTTDSVASQSSVDQLARAWRPMRKLRRKNCVSLFRRGTRYRNSVSCDLAKLPIAGGDCVLDFRFVPHRRNLYRF